jgi:tRNA dimethylallyltransferase
MWEAPLCGDQSGRSGPSHIEGHEMTRVFFIVGPTATGKSEIAAEIATQLDAEIISADAFQIYHGLDLLTAKPEKTTLAKTPHHLLSAVPSSEEMNVEKFRGAAVEAIRDIHASGKDVIVVGGSGLYVKALTHGLSRLPAADPKLRAQLRALSLDELRGQLMDLDPKGAAKVDMKNRRRVTRALEICLLTDRPASEQRFVAAHAERDQPRPTTAAIDGVFVFRERAELYERINRRVEKMFADGVVEEVRALPELGPTAEKTLGLSEIRALIAGQISETECVARIQQATRRYAKRQLTWFRRQSNFQPLNLSLHGFPEVIESIAQNARRTFAQIDD